MVAFELRTIPTFLFSPSSKHPDVDALVFPACMRIPSNEGTFISCGVYFLNLGEYVHLISYVPYGIAVLPLIFFSPLSNLPSLLRSLTVSSSVSQKYLSSIYSLPIVYVGFKAILFNVSFVLLELYKRLLLLYYNLQNHLGLYEDTSNHQLLLQEDC